VGWLNHQLRAVGDNVLVEGAFAIVLFVVVGLAVVGAIVSLILSGDAYGHIGRGGLSIGEDRPLRPPPSPAPGAPISAGQAAEREADIRSMLEARNARRAARGEPVADVDAELRALLRPAAPTVDAGLEAEVRELVESRNARRVARGEEPLDVDAEVARRLREYGA
jgi:hypothetical protein